MIFRLGELFCGPGGLAFGATHANIGNGDAIVHVWANDYDLDTCQTYTRNICPYSPESVICCDVRKLNIEQLAPIDALAFGFPCNDFSVVGEQKGFNGTYGPLYSYGVKVLKSHHPLWFLAENVGGLKSANDGNAFQKILQDLNECGYQIYPHLYKFEQYGIPQARHRIIIVGIRNDLNVTFLPPSPAPYQEIDNTCATALEIPPIPADAPNHELTRQSPQVVERLEHIRPGENAFTANLPEHLQLHVEGAKISQIYKRLDPEKPAYTVTGSGGGGTHIYHYREPRALTNRERARLQTFPDDFVFCGSKESVRKQIGMAVPQRGAKIIFEAILKSFAGIPYKEVIEEKNLSFNFNSSGSGYMQVLQILAPIYTVCPTDCEVVLLDEPDAHLHPNMQIALAKSLKNIQQDLGIQIIIATHSPSIIKTAAPNEIIPVSANNPLCTPLSSENEVYDSIALMDNYELAKTIIGGKIIFLEDEKTDILEQIDSLLGTKLFSGSIITNIIKGRTKDDSIPFKIKPILRQFLQKEIKIYYLKDSDGLPCEWIDQWQQYARNCDISLHILERYEIENYILNSDLILRALRLKNGGQQLPTAKEIDAKIITFLKETILLASYNYTQNLEDMRPRFLQSRFVLFGNIVEERIGFLKTILTLYVKHVIFRQQLIYKAFCRSGDIERFYGEFL